jgi:hypothetical protein
VGTTYFRPFYIGALQNGKGKYHKKHKTEHKGTKIGPKTKGLCAFCVFFVPLVICSRPVGQSPKLERRGKPLPTGFGVPRKVNEPVFLAGIDGQVILTGHRRVHKFEQNVIADPFDVTVTPDLERECAGREARPENLRRSVERRSLAAELPPGTKGYRRAAQ